MRSICGCSLAILLMTTATAAPAAPDQQSAEASAVAPLRVLVLLQPETDTVLARIRGQTSDLRADLLVDSLDSMPGDPGAQLRLAYALSRQRNTSIVIWFAQSASSAPHFVVNIAIPDQRRLLTRDLGPSNATGEDTGLASSVKESAALVVRAAIQTVLGGSSIGDTEQWSKAPVHPAPADETTPNRMSQQAVPAAAPSAPSANLVRQRGAAEPMPRPPSSAPAESPLPPARSASREWPWALGAEWRSVYDGATGHAIAECASLRAERSVQWFRALADASVCPARQIDSGKYGAFRIARQQAALGASVTLWQTWFDASMGLRAGAVAYERTTLPSPGAAPSKTHVVATGGPEFRLVAPVRGSRIQGGVTMGVDFFTRSIRIGYRDPAVAEPQHFAQTTLINVVQPYIALGLGFRW